MKKLLIILLSLMSGCSSVAFGFSPTVHEKPDTIPYNQNLSSYGYVISRIIMDSVFVVPNSDTTSGTDKIRPGSLVYRTAGGDSTLYLRLPSKWVRVGTAGLVQVLSKNASGDSIYLSGGGGTILDRDSQQLSLITGAISGDTLKLTASSPVVLPYLARSHFIDSLNNNRQILGYNSTTNKLWLSDAVDDTVTLNTGSVLSVNGRTGNVVLTTDSINEGSVNLYFTTARARTSIFGSAGISFNQSTGIISPQISDAAGNSLKLNTDGLYASSVDTTSLSNRINAKQDTGVSYTKLQADGRYLPFIGGIITGPINYSATPIASSELVNKAYVDALSSGLSWKNAVVAATTGNITLSGLQGIDGVSVVIGSRVLVKNQTDSTQNGIYIADTSAWTRTTDANTGTLIKGMAVYVDAGGAVNGGTQWVNANTSVPTIGTTGIIYTQFGATSVTVPPLVQVLQAGDSTSHAMKVGATTVQSLTMPNTINAPFLNTSSTGLVGAGTVLPIGTITGLQDSLLAKVNIKDSVSIYTTHTSLNDSLNKMGSKIDTINTIPQLESYNRNPNVNLLFVTDSLRGGLFYYSTIGTLDSGTVFPANGKGSGYWVRNYEKGHINALWFGAKGDSLTNNNIALNALFASNASKGATILFPSGIYLVSDSIMVNDSCTIVGNGGKNVYQSKARPFTLLHSGMSSIIETGTSSLFVVNANQVTFKDIALSTNDTLSTGDGIRFNKGYSLSLQNISVSSFRINLNLITANHYNIDNCIFDEPRLYSINVQDTINTDEGSGIVSNSTFQFNNNPHTTGINFQSGGGFRVMNCEFNPSTIPFGVDYLINLVPLPKVLTSVVVITNNQMEGFDSAAINYLAKDSANLESLIFSHNEINSFSPSNHMISLVDSNTTHESIAFVVSNNTLLRNLTSSSLIYMNNIYGATISGNVFDTIADNNKYQFVNCKYISILQDSSVISSMTAKDGYFGTNAPPGYSLSVGGAIYATGDATAVSQYLSPGQSFRMISPSTTSSIYFDIPRLFFRDNSNGYSPQLSIVNGQIGIGTSSPGYTLDVNGTINFTVLHPSLGSDATGDTYYRNSTGTISRLPIGTTGQIWTVAGGLPTWATAPFAPTSGGTGYIQNQYLSAQPASWWIGGKTRNDAGTFNVYDLTTGQNFNVNTLFINDSVNYTSPAVGMSQYVTNSSVELDNTHNWILSGGKTQIGGVLGGLTLNGTGTTTWIYNDAGSPITGLIGETRAFNNSNYGNVSSINAYDIYSYTQGGYTTFTGHIDTMAQVELSGNTQGVGNISTKIGSQYGILQLSTYPNSFNGGVQMPIRVISANYTATPSDYTIVIKAALTLTLPTASTIPGQIYHIASVGVTTTISTYYTLVGSASTTVNSGTSITIQSDGTNWQQIGN